MDTRNAGVRLERLTQTAFASFGEVIQNPTIDAASWSQTPESVSANQGSATKFLEVTNLTNHYGTTSGREPARVSFNMFVCKPRTLSRQSNADARHPVLSSTHKEVDGQHPELGGIVPSKQDPADDRAQSDSDHPEYGGAQPVSTDSQPPTSSAPINDHPEFGGAQARDTVTKPSSSAGPGSEHPEFGGTQPVNTIPGASTSGVSDNDHPEFGGAHPASEPPSSSSRGASNDHPEYGGVQPAPESSPRGRHASHHNSPQRQGGQLAGEPASSSSRLGSSQASLDDHPEYGGMQPVSRSAAPSNTSSSTTITTTNNDHPEWGGAQPISQPPNPSSSSSSDPQYFQVSILERHPYTSQTFIPLGLSPSSSDTAYVVIVAPTLPLTSSSNEEIRSRARPYPIDVSPPPRRRRSLKEVFTRARPAPYSNASEPSPPSQSKFEETSGLPEGLKMKGRGKPDLSRVRAFLADGSQAVTYGPGTWHAPMVVVGKRSVDFVVVQYVNGVSEDDCQEIELKSDGSAGEGLRVVFHGEVGNGAGVKAKL